MWLHDFSLGPFQVGIVFKSHYFTFLQGRQGSGSFVVVAFLVLLLALAVSVELVREAEGILLTFSRD